MKVKYLRGLFIACAAAGFATFMIAGASGHDIFGIKDRPEIDTCDTTKCIELPAFPEKGQGPDPS